MSVKRRNYIGQRLFFDSLCTVRYIGPVASTKGAWLGVEWDDPSRGKHSGTHQGVEYFDCLSEVPTAGSFVRPTRPCEESRTFKEAIEEKYASEYYRHREAIEAGDQGQDQTIWISGKEVQEIGFEKIRKQLADLKELKVVILDGLRTARPNVRASSKAQDGQEAGGTGDEDDVKQTCPKVYELDLSRNMFEDWDEVLDIIRQLPLLLRLKISGNRFKHFERLNGSFRPIESPFNTLEGLTADENLASWTQITELVSTFTALKTLSAAGNQLRSISLEALPTTLSTINLERNNLATIYALRPLTRLPNLKSLSLKLNCISEIAEHGTDVGSLVFTSTLEHVDLSFNEIKDWAFISILPRVFPGLVSLRTSHNPLYSNLVSAEGRLLSEADGYMLTLARLGCLKILNFSEVTDKERLNAETYYLSQIAHELSAVPEQSSSLVIEKHDRYKELCVKYGDPVVKRNDGAASFKPDALGARVISLAIYLDKSITSHSSSLADPNRANITSQSWHVEVPRDTSIYTLSSLIGRRYGIQPTMLQLTLLIEPTTSIDAQRKGGREMKEDQRNAEMGSHDEEHQDITATGEARVSAEISASTTGISLSTRSRPLRSWIDYDSARIQVGWSQSDLGRKEQAHVSIAGALKVMQSPSTISA